jgi:methylmalonyl-CoA/ethylmalonyl-CoA epimerase
MGVSATTSEGQLPVGMAGLRYPITQVSLVVDDIDALLERYYQTFGWAPWQDFDHFPPIHRNTEYRGKPVEYSLRGAEVYVGSLNFELLKPIPGGESLFHDHLQQHGDGIASIASMFHEQADSDAVKVAFKEHFGLDVLLRANIGDHIEYWYADTQAAFGCPIESGSGHAIDFVGPARVYPHPGAEFGPSPRSGISYRISQVTLVARDLDPTVANYQRAFGWGPWRFFDSRQDNVLERTALRGQPTALDMRFAQTMVGDMNFEIVQPRGGSDPWQEFLDRRGEGLVGITVAPIGPDALGAARSQFESAGVEELVSTRVGHGSWHLYDTQQDFKTLIALGSTHAYDVGHEG